MSCDVALAAYLFLASASPAAPAPQAAPPSVAREPLFMDIIGRAGRLKGEVEAYRRTDGLKASSARIVLPGMARFEKDISDLAALDMQGHVELAKRGTDGDLKCILKGISQDLPVKLRELEQASTGVAEDTALRDMAYLLNDNVEVITAPPAPPV
jgi:hypothetical protein